MNLQWQTIRAQSLALLARAAGDFDELKHPRDERGRFASGGGGGGAADAGGGLEQAFVPIGLATPAGSDFAKAGIHEISYKDSAAVTRTMAEATGASLGPLRESRGGWTDPETNIYTSEPTLVADLKAKPESITLTADAIAHVLEQKEVWVVRDGEGLPSARDLRLDIIPTKEFTAQQISDVARKVDPNLFSGFTETVDDHGRKGISILVKDGIAPWKSEPTSTIIKGYGQPFAVQINPTERDIRAMIKDSEYHEVRVILDREKNLYVWDADMAIHASVQHVLDLDAKDWDIWIVHDGDLISGREPQGELSDEEALLRGQRMLELWDPNQSTPHGAAAVSAAADVGLLHLVTALDKAGIDADILPTAVSIDKRVAGNDGHAAQIERQAGLGAVAALDDYRSRLVEAIKAGRAVPAFDVDLVAFARAHQRAEAAKVKHWRPRSPSFEKLKRWKLILARSHALLGRAAGDFDEGKHPRDEHGRWTDGGGGDPSSPQSIADSLAQAEREHQAHLSRVKAALDKLPNGYEIKYKKETFTHTDVGGDKFWISNKGKGYTAIQLYEHVGHDALIPHIGHEALGLHAPAPAPAAPLSFGSNRQVYTRPSDEEVHRWDRQINALLKAIPDAQWGSKEETELQRMTGALGAWFRASDAERTSGARGIVIITDVDSEKALAALAIKWDEKQKKAELDFHGAIDPAAKLESIRQAVSLYSEVHHAEMIEAIEWKDDEESIKQYEQAGFKRAGDNKFGLQRMVWGTDKPFELPDPTKLTHDEIVAAVSDVAHDTGFDPFFIKIRHGDSPFMLNGKEYMAAGTAYTRTTKDIVIWEDHVQPWAVEGTVRHEIEHIQFQHALDTAREESKAVMNDPGTVAGGAEGGMRPDGSLPPTLAAKYPVYSLMNEAYQNPDPKKFEASDGVSNYSYEYWKGWKNRMVSYELAMHETLAEMARIKYETGKFPDHMGEHIISYRGEDVPKLSQATMDANAKIWRDLFRAVETIWKEHPPK